MDIYRGPSHESSYFEFIIICIRAGALQKILYNVGFEDILFQRSKLGLQLIFLQFLEP